MPPDLLLNGLSTSLMRSRRVVDCIANLATIGVTLPAGPSIMVLDAGLDLSRLADVDYLIVRCIGWSQYRIDAASILK